MWELVATAVSGLNAGAGLQAALAGAPSAASDLVSFTRFAGRSRMLSLLLSMAATSSCVTAYYRESRGALWLAAAAGVGLLIPFNLLMMAPPTAVVSSGASILAPMSPRVRFATESAAPASGEGLLSGTSADEDKEAAAAATGEAGDDVPASPFATNGGGVPMASDRGGGLSSATIAPQLVAPRQRRLMYSKSGMLVSPSDFESSWARKYWFSAFLSLTAFACMIDMISTGKDAATYGSAPF